MGRKNRGLRRAVAAWLLATTVSATATVTDPHACPFDRLTAPDLSTRRLTIIASDHETDVFEPALRRLRESNPDAISLEQYVSPYNVGEIIDMAKSRRWKERLLSGEERYTMERTGNTVIIRMGDLVVFDGRGRASESNAGLAYAMETGKPFYFTDWGWEFPDVMFRFEGGRITPVHLAGRTTYQNFPYEFSTYEGKVQINVSNVRARNRFTADGLRLIYRDHRSIAHIGGMYHFTSHYGDDARLQTLLPTGQQAVHFLVDPN